MRRVAAIALTLLTLGACTTEAERPEGIVERWLLALNQGSAGEPERYAVAEVSEDVLPGWAELDPGELDTIEVGRGEDRCEVYVACESRVPIRVIHLDGTEIRRDAIVPSSTGPPAGPGRLVVALAEADPRLRVPSEGGTPIGGATVAAWTIVLGLGLALAAVSELFLLLVARGAGVVTGRASRVRNEDGGDR